MKDLELKLIFAIAEGLICILRGKSIEERDAAANKIVNRMIDIYEDKAKEQKEREG